jgi:hypothetical protein
MGLARVSPGERGFEERTFEYATCHRIEKLSFSVDPLRTDSRGLAGRRGKAAALRSLAQNKPRIVAGLFLIWSFPLQAL